MALRAGGIEHWLMTTEQPDSGLPLERPSSDRSVGAGRLRRRTSDRVIGGVAGGLGDYLNVDPVLLRAAFAGLMIFGGAGLVLYVMGWLLIPEDGQAHSILESSLRRLAGRAGRLGVVILALATILIVSPWVTSPYGGPIYVAPEVFWALGIVAVGVALLLPQARPSPGAATEASLVQGSVRPAPPIGPSPPEAATTGHWGPAVAAPPRPRARSPLAWYAVAGVLVVLAALAVVGNLAPVRVVPGQYFGAGILALGIGLVVGAWWGRARILIPLGILVLPLAAISAFLTVPLEGGLADEAFRPQNVAEVHPTYRVLGGRLRLDLTALQAGSDPVTVAASIGIGEIYVMVPKDAHVEVVGSVEGGRLFLFGRDHVGTGLADQVFNGGASGGPSLVLTLEAGLGTIWVERIPLGGYE
jgi:phage shock protein PspC (stress-responsive transcriptional regulator)